MRIEREAVAVAVSGSLELERGANAKGRREKRAGVGGFDSCRHFNQWERSARAMFGPGCASIGGLEGPRDFCRIIPVFCLFQFFVFSRFFIVEQSKWIIILLGTEPVPYSDAGVRSFQSSARFDEQQHPRRAGKLGLQSLHCT